MRSPPWGNDVLNARDVNRMELEAEAFIDRLFDEWMEGHFGARLKRALEGGPNVQPTVVRPGGAPEEATGLDLGVEAASEDRGGGAGPGPGGYIPPA